MAPPPRSNEPIAATHEPRGPPRARAWGGGRASRLGARGLVAAATAASRAPLSERRGTGGPGHRGRELGGRPEPPAPSPPQVGAVRVALCDVPCGYSQRSSVWWPFKMWAGSLGQSEGLLGTRRQVLVSLIYTYLSHTYIWKYICRIPRDNAVYLHMHTLINWIGLHLVALWSWDHDSLRLYLPSCHFKISKRFQPNTLKCVHFPYLCGKTMCKSKYILSD